MPFVKLYGNLRKIAAEAGFEPAPASIELPGETVRALLSALCARAPALRLALLDQDVLRPHIRLMVNGRDIELAQGLETPLRPEDQVSIFPPIAGGR